MADAGSRFGTGQTNKRRKWLSAGAVTAAAALIGAVGTFGQWALPKGLQFDSKDSTVAGTTALLTIRNGFNAKCMDVFQFSVDDNADVVQYECNGKENQNWSLTPSHTIVNAFSNKCLDLAALAKNNATKVVQRTCNNQPNQHWTNGKDRYGNRTLRNSYDNRCLDGYSFQEENGGSLVVYDCDDLENQVWVIAPRRPA